MEDIAKIKQEIERTKNELTILYEISNAMRTTLKLDEILYIILTGVTAHIGLGFNRALLFLVNEEEGTIEGKMAIGPESGEEADRIWKRIEQENIGLDDLINVCKVIKPGDTASREADDNVKSGFTRQVRNIKIPLHERNGGLLAMGILEGMPLHLTKEIIPNYGHDQIILMLKSEELIMVPLKAKDKVNGIILADNFITKKPITKDDMRMLLMLANQAGLAIENSHLYEKTVIRAHSDSLTGLWNHGYCQYLLQAELEKAKLKTSPLSIIMLDIDNFKVYNDKLGHQVGDSTLKELTSLLKNKSRKIDFVCRYGGEEFVSILPQTDKKEAFLIAERLRQEIEKYHFSHEEILPNNKLTASLAVASFPDDAKTPSELLAHADKALYQAKHKGKNNTCC